MLVKSQVKYIQSLGHKKFRDADGVFVAEGPKIVLEFLKNRRVNVVECYATESWLQAHPEVTAGRESRFIQINERELERISFHPSPNEVLAVFTKPVFTEDEPSAGFTLMLDAIQDPGNLGTIIRTADWFGVGRVICSFETADVFSPKVVQSAMGSLIRVSVRYADLEGLLPADAEVPVYASTLDGEDYTGEKLDRRGFLIMGNESKGIRPGLEMRATKKIRISGRGGAESLNVAVATGILLSRIAFS